MHSPNLTNNATITKLSSSGKVWIKYLTFQYFIFQVFINLQFPVCQEV
jgi:hypothetical protein